jgi:hypothetical protein
MFINRILRRIFGLNKVGGLLSHTKLHNEELHNLYHCPNIIRMTKSKSMRWEEHIACMGEMKNSHKTFMRKSEVKRPRYMGG